MICTPDTAITLDSDQSRRFRQWWIPVACLSLLVTLLSLAGCELTTGKSVTRPDVPPNTKTGAPVPRPHVIPTRPPTAAEMASTDRVSPTNVPTPPADLWERLRRRFRFQGLEHLHIETELNRLRHNPVALRALFNQAMPYLYYIANEVETRDMPGEIALLPMVESGFRPRAYSPNGAAGLWQFMPGTARMLGLRRDRWYDGRRDVLAATLAALQYLAFLHRQLDDDWLHALAAYNCGIGTVRQAIRRAARARRSIAYWELDLPDETDAYVPRLLAIARIVADPDAFGIALPSLADRPQFATIETDAPLDLAVAARLAEVPLAEFLRLNPAYPRGVTPPDRPATLLISIERQAAFKKALATLPKRQWRHWAEHHVKRGDSLIHIARRYRVSMSAIRQANGLRGHLIRTGRILRIPLSGQAGDRQQGIAVRHGPRIRYRVRKGDSLYTIAHKFQVSVRNLKRWNKVGRYIRPGQRLVVYPGSAG